MSRYCGKSNSTPILSAASVWRRQALESDGSVFLPASIWTLDNVQLLDKYFVQNLDMGEGNYITKLREQLEPTPPAVKQLAAEMNWVMLLCPSNISALKKREVVNEIWRWSEAAPPQSPLLEDSVLGGIGSAGTAFNTHRWRELVFFVNAMLLWKALPPAQRLHLLTDPWEFGQWLQAVPDSAARQFRHMLLFMLFPDEFERLFAQGERHSVVNAFSHLSLKEAKAMTPLDVDRKLRQIRHQLEQEYGREDLDYYVPPLSQRWERARAPKAEPGSAEQTLGNPLLSQDSGNYHAPTEREFTLDQAVEGLFIQPSQFSRLVERLRDKKNMILQGPPGVGKTFFARRLAYALMGKADPDRVHMVQFHPAYSYEDFVQGYRPSGQGFALRDGPFYRFCTLAASRPNEEFVFIIDEINRSNLGKVFGELLMLIEADKRGAEWAISLAYSEEQQGKFFVPPNVYLLGMMNTADRSLAVVDYALRRRFAFIDVEPGFGTPQFAGFLKSTLNATDELVGTITRQMTALNKEIMEDEGNLGSGFCIGHSYFCSGVGEVGAATPEWYAEVIRSEILPLLREYWFDDLGKVKKWERLLLDE